MADNFDTTTISASSASFSLYGESEINAPASFVYETYIDISTWPSWNTFNPQVNIINHALDNQSQSSPIVTIHNAQKIDGQLQTLSPVIREGTLLNMANTVQKSGLSSFSIFLCYDADAEKRSVSWVYESEMNPYPKAMLEIERTTVVEDLGNDRSKLRNLERQRGVRAAYSKIRHAKALQKGFEAQAQGLKRYVEAKYKS
jgi:hypothetical protein